MPMPFLEDLKRKRKTSLEKLTEANPAAAMLLEGKERLEGSFTEPTLMNLRIEEKAKLLFERGEGSGDLLADLQANAGKYIDAYFKVPGRKLEHLFKSQSRAASPT